MTEKDFIASARAGKGGGFLFFGEEDLLKTRYIEMAKKAVCPDETLDSFNYLRIGADNFSPVAVENAVTALPLMADMRMIVMSGIRYSSLKQDVLNDLLYSLSLIESNPQTLFIALTSKSEFDPGYLPKRPSKIYTELTKYLEPVMFSRPGEADLKKWICRHFAAERINADIRIAGIMIRHTGHDMMTLESEIEKLCFYLHANGKDTVSEEDIEAVVSQNTEAEDFAFSNALRVKNKRRAFELLDMMKGEKVEEIVILGMISRFFIELF
ncbi:MAG: hypothetical protein IJT91_01070, partial [Clostridia bacterium]|nr:hypothetical protein [Clostridia bacterium]